VFGRAETGRLSEAASAQPVASCVWDAALCTEELLKPSSLQLMWTPAKQNDGKPNKAGYGFGWCVADVRGHRVVEHAGAWQGFTTNISRCVDDKLTVAVLTNLAGANPATITHHVAGLCDPALLPPPEMSVEDREPQVAALLGDLLQGIADGRADPEVFTPDLRQRLFPDAINDLEDPLHDWGERSTALPSEVRSAGIGSLVTGSCFRPRASFWSSN
jgi:hypothetical protein